MAATVARLVVLFVLVVSCVASPCDVTGPGQCLSRAGLASLNTGDDSYCFQAAKLIQQMIDCLNNCNFPTASNNGLTSAIQQVDSVCSAMPDCANFMSRYLQFGSSFDQFGSLNNIVDAVRKNFNAGDATALYSACSNLTWGRQELMTVVGNCAPLNDLQYDFFSNRPQLVAAWYTCGGVDVTPKYGITANSTCNPGMIDSLNTQCSVSCAIAAANNVTAVCQALSAQLACILNVTDGCSPAQSNYLVPRLATYWAANELLGCGLQYLGFNIRPTSFARVLTGVLRPCFNFSSSSGFMSVDGFKQLLLMQFPPQPLCELLAATSRSQVYTNCKLAVLSSVIATGQVYGDWPPIFPSVSFYADETYQPYIGPFAANVWGLTTLLQNLDVPTCTVKPVMQCSLGTTLPPLQQPARTTPNMPMILRGKGTPEPTPAATPAAGFRRGTPAVTRRATPAPRTTPLKNH